jgi:hypothetical protein
MDEKRRKTELKLIILTVFLVIAGISVVLFFSVSNSFISLNKDWPLIIQVYGIFIAITLISFIPGLFNDRPLLTRTQEEWDDPFEREIILDIPFNTAFNRSLGSVSLLKCGKITSSDRQNGMITVKTNNSIMSGFYLEYSHNLEDWYQSTITYSLKRLEHSQTLVHVKSSRTFLCPTAYGINKNNIDAICEYLLSDTESGER